MQNLEIRNIITAGATSRIITTTTSNVTLGNAPLTDYVCIVWGNAIITLPTAVTNWNSYTVKNIFTSNISVVFTGGQNADAVTSVSINSDTSLTFISNWSNWYII